MKILVISGRYPPYYTGGYELGCQDAVEALRRRQHDVRVLTSTYGLDRMQDNGHVYRWLKASPNWRPLGFVNLLRKERLNQQAFRRMVQQFKPDVVYIWKLNRVSVSLAFLAQQMGLTVSYYVFDRWITTWQNDPWYILWQRPAKRRSTQMLKRLIRPLIGAAGLLYDNSLDFSHAQLCSHYIKRYALEAGTPVEDAEVIHWGVDPVRFAFKTESEAPKHLLYVGRVVPHKGVHTAVEALQLLAQDSRYDALHLTIVGNDGPSDYLMRIKAAVHMQGLRDRVHFVSFTSRDELPAIYRAHDVLLFPSVWDEPFGITVLEGMSSGLVVIGTGTGGGGEVLEHDANGLVFPKEDAAACAQCIASLVDDPARYERLRQGGRAAVEQRFNLDRAIDEIELSLQKAVM